MAVYRAARSDRRQADRGARAGRRGAALPGARAAAPAAGVGAMQAGGGACAGLDDGGSSSAGRRTRTCQPARRTSSSPIRPARKRAIRSGMISSMSRPMAAESAVVGTSGALAMAAGRRPALRRAAGAVDAVAASSGDCGDGRAASSTQTSSSNGGSSMSSAAWGRSGAISGPPRAMRPASRSERMRSVRPTRSTRGAAAGSTAVVKAPIAR